MKPTTPVAAVATASAPGGGPRPAPAAVASASTTPPAGGGGPTIVPPTPPGGGPTASASAAATPPPAGGGHGPTPPRPPATPPPANRAGWWQPTGGKVWGLIAIAAVLLLIMFNPFSGRTVVPPAAPNQTASGTASGDIGPRTAPVINPTGPITSDDVRTALLKLGTKMDDVGGQVQNLNNQLTGKINGVASDFAAYQKNTDATLATVRQDIQNLQQNGRPGYDPTRGLYAQAQVPPALGGNVAAGGLQQASTQGPPGVRVYSNQEIAQFAQRTDRLVGKSTGGFALTDDPSQPPCPGGWLLKTAKDKGGVGNQWACPRN